MACLARRNLFHDRVRLTVTLTGIVFSVVLTTIQLGLFVGFQTATSDMIDKSGADLWVVSKNVGYLETGVPFSERKLYQILSTPGVQAAQKHIIQFGFWKLPSGAMENVLLVGFNPESRMGVPWNITAGSVSDLKAADTVMIDELYREKLGVTQLNQVVEIRGRRARVVGFTRGIRTFTTSPAVFTSFKNAQNYFGLREDQTIYALVQAAPGADLQVLKKRLVAGIPDVDVYTTGEWSRKQRSYWMLGTGAGLSVLIAAGLGLLVGVVVVAQTIYASTIDHLREYGTLKAMGATNRYIYRVIIKQAVISACIGYGFGLGVSLAVAVASQSGTTAVIVPWQLAAGLFLLTIFMCVGASLFSINKVTRLDPAAVFKG